MNHEKFYLWKLNEFGRLNQSVPEIVKTLSLGSEIEYYYLLIQIPFGLYKIEFSQGLQIKGDSIVANHGSMGYIEGGCYNGYKLVESEHFSPFKEDVFTGNPIVEYMGSPRDQQVARSLGIPIIHNSQRNTYTYTPHTNYQNVKPVPFVR